MLVKLNVRINNNSRKFRQKFLTFHIGIIKMIDIIMKALFMEDKNILQIIKGVEDKTLVSIEEARIDAAQRLKNTKTRIAQDEEKILEDFREKMANMESGLKQTIENMKKEGDKKLRDEIIKLEQEVKINQEKAMDLIMKNFMNIC